MLDESEGEEVRSETLDFCRVLWIWVRFDSKNRKEPRHGAKMDLITCGNRNRWFQASISFSIDTLGR